MNELGEVFEEKTYKNAQFVHARGTLLVYSHLNINMYCAHRVLRCKIVLKVVFQGWRLLLCGLVWWDRWVALAPFLVLVVLVDAMCTNTEYTGVDATSCGVFDVMEKRMHALN